MAHALQAAQAQAQQAGLTGVAVQEYAMQAVQSLLAPGAGGPEGPGSTYAAPYAAQYPGRPHLLREASPP